MTDYILHTEINVSEALRVMIVKIDERLMRFLEGRSEYMHHKILEEMALDQTTQCHVDDATNLPRIENPKGLLCERPPRNSMASEDFTRSSYWGPADSRHNTSK